MQCCFRTELLLNHHVNVRMYWGTIAPVIACVIKDTGHLYVPLPACFRRVRSSGSFTFFHKQSLEIVYLKVRESDRNNRHTRVRLSDTIFARPPQPATSAGCC